MNTSHKICSLSTCAYMCKSWQQKGETIAFTNGCFDVLHAGHITLLEAARATGQHLIVGLNSDASVARLKGADRPIHSFMARARVLAALSAVDIVVGFEEDTPASLIQRLLPNILIKGGDYRAEEVVGAEILKKYGGKVLIVPLLPKYSSSACIEKIRKTNTEQKT